MRTIAHARFASSSITIPVAILATALALVGCSDATSPDTTLLGIAFQAGIPNQNGLVIGHADDPVWQLTITEATVVIGGLEVSGDQDTVQFRGTGDAPLVVPLDLTGRARYSLISAVTPGEFSSSSIRFRPVDSTDGQTWNGNPDLQGVSFRVEGYLNGDPTQTFVFTSALDDEQLRAFPPFVIGEQQSRMVTFHLDYSRWFSHDDGSLVNPDNLQLSTSRSMVEYNFLSSFTAN